MDKKNDPQNILFGYSNVPAYGQVGEDDGGFSVAVYEDGRLTYKTYLFDEIDRTEVEYKISDGSASAIKALMKKHQKAIDTFDCHLDNGSCDGSGNFFIFNGKQVITWNICYTNPLFFIFCKEYLPVAKQENRILSLFFAVTKILKNDGINLNLNRVNFRKGSSY
jgi:hypothetical protein